MHMHTHIVGHLVRRGLEEFSGRQQYMDKMQQDAEAYENAGPDMRVTPSELLPIFITILLGVLVTLSIDYTIGQVMSSLACIESSSTTTIIESKAPPPYTDEKEVLLPEADMDMDVEVTVIQHKPITSTIRTTIGHLHRIGGFRARWRGAGVGLIYTFLHSVAVNTITHALGLGLLGAAATFVVVSVALARLHMSWTHAMIANPRDGAQRRCNKVAAKDCRPLLLPALVYAAAEQATLILPLAVAFSLGLVGPHAHEQREALMESGCPKAMLLHGLKMLAVPLTYAFVGMAVLFPASVTLTRVEALLLSEEDETIVPFDKAAILGDIDVNARGGSRALFLSAWRSFDRAARWRLVKLYIKMFFIQLTVLLVTVHLVIFQLYVLGAERMSIFMKSAGAQIKLAAMEAHEGQHHVEGH